METARSMPATSLSRRTQLCIHSRTRQRLKANHLSQKKNDAVAGTTLVATVYNDFVRQLPGAHALQMLRVVLVGSCGF